MTTNNGDVTIATDELTVVLRPLGATISKLLYAGKDGVVRDLVMGYDTADAQADCTAHPYVGTVGRFANRIANGTFNLNGKSYSLAQNNGPNSLHGGVDGFDRRVWDVVATSQTSVSFQLTSPADDQGFPLAVIATVVYEVVDSSLHISYGAAVADSQDSSDEGLETIVNLTTHSYFNLSGMVNPTILTHTAYFPDSRGHLVVTEHQIPTGEISTSVSGLDFTSVGPGGKSFGTDMQLVQQFRGYDHFYVRKDFATADKDVVLAAVVRSPESGIRMEMSSDAVGFQLYTANWNDGTVKGKSTQPPGTTFGSYSSFCLETSAPPDAINSDNENIRALVTIKKGKDWSQKTVYKFSKA
ncbi:hypothetical protein HDU82_000183 [Entophlyctis luteolus]|nr:hypothetical protein HDU82_000183 [Entophlyctis luteolus]